MGSSLYVKILAEEILRELGIDADINTCDSAFGAAGDADILLVTSPIVYQTVGSNVKAKKTVVLKNIVNKELVRRDLVSAVSEFIDLSGKSDKAC